MGSSNSHLLSRLLYEREPSTFWDVSCGQGIGEDLYLIMAYTLYRPPKGIARFPDGGVPVVAFHRTALYRRAPRSGGRQELLLLSVDTHQGENLKNSMVFFSDHRILFLYQYRQGGRLDSEAWRAVAWNTEKGSAVEVGREEKRKLLSQGRLGAREPGTHTSSDLKARLAPFVPEDWGLPSPLQYAAKSPKRYGDDLVLLRGDQAYREAILRAIRAGEVSVNPDELLGRIELRERRLSGAKRRSYQIEVAETKQRLEALR